MTIIDTPSYGESDEENGEITKVVHKFFTGTKVLEYNQKQRITSVARLNPCVILDDRSQRT